MSVGAAQTFNDDLLANPDDIVRARSVYPRIVHVLDHPELRELFQIYDLAANRAKRRMHRAGLRTVAFGLLSLILAAGLLVFGSYLKEKAPAFEPALALLAAVSGLASILSAMGILRARDKETWLSARYMTERLRQFHFQSMICCVADIAASQEDEAAAQQFKDKRTAWLARFRDIYEDKQSSELENILLGEEESDYWLFPRPFQPVAAAEAALAPVFDAYRNLRIHHQIQYVSLKLGHSHTVFPSLPRSQVALFSNVSFFCIALLLVADIGVALGVTFESWHALAAWFQGGVAHAVDGPAASAGGHKGATVTDVLHLAALILAIGVLAIRALEEGLKPDRELERYIKYRSSLRAIRDRFDAADTAAEKLECMKQMERLSFDEMCEFLRTQAHARFVM